MSLALQLLDRGQCGVELAAPDVVLAVEPLQVPQGLVELGAQPVLLLGLPLVLTPEPGEVALEQGDRGPFLDQLLAPAGLAAPVDLVLRARCDDQRVPRTQLIDPRLSVQVSRPSLLVGNWSAVIRDEVAPAYDGWRMSLRNCQWSGHQPLGVVSQRSSTSS